MEEEATTQAEREEDYLTLEPKFELLYQTLKTSCGTLDNDNVVNIGLQLASAYIGNYKLNHCDTLLKDLLPQCEKRGGLFQIKAREALAFCRWKQGRFEEALDVFNWQLEVVGPNIALYENMGHTYNKISKFDDAERCFKESLALMEKGDPHKSGQKGGIYLGLANVQQSKGNLQNALESRMKALETYTTAYGSYPHSLVAKANMYVGQTYMQLVEEFKKAEPFFRESLRLFKITCGPSPLTLQALCELGDFLICVNTPPALEEAHKVYREALDIQLDLETVHIREVAHTVKMIMDHPPSSTKKNEGPITPERVKEMYAYLRDYFPTIKKILVLVMSQKQNKDAKFVDMLLVLSNLFLLAGEAATCQEVIFTIMEVTSKMDKELPIVKEAVSHCSGILQYFVRNK